MQLVLSAMIISGRTVGQPRRLHSGTPLSGRTFKTHATSDIGEGSMAIEFNHTILSARDSRASATFLSEMMGLPAPTHWGPFQAVTTDNGANLDYMDADDEITPQHYAFLVSETEFDEIFGRIRERKLSYWADPAQTRQGEINHHDGGRGLYFKELNGHLLEIITRPYGSGGWNP